MRNWLVILILLFSAGFTQAQINATQSKRGPCFQESLERLGQRYVDWECDERDNIVDCNQKLEQDPNSRIVRTRSSGAPYNGDCETCHRNGIRQRLVHFNNGLVDGTDTTYYQSGCPQVVRTHIEGVENGTWTFYNDTSGLVAWKINYFNGEKHGKSIFYRQHQVGTKTLKVQIGNAEKKIEYNTYQNDTLKIEQYKEGRLHGVKKEYFPGSKLKKEVHYQEGVLHGAFIVYNSDGNTLQELEYDEGEKDGNWKFYYNDGSLMKTQLWDSGTKDGAFKTFYIQGHIQSIENYRRGKKHGEFMERFPDDKIKREAVYKRDKLIEEHVYDEYGNEIRTVGEEGAENKDEDDEVPENGKQKKWWQFWK